MSKLERCYKVFVEGTFYISLVGAQPPPCCSFAQTCHLPICSSLSTLPETNIAFENRPSQKETILFQPSISRGELLVSGRVPTFTNKNHLNVG